MLWTFTSHSIPSFIRIHRVFGNEINIWLIEPQQLRRQQKNRVMINGFMSIKSPAKGTFGDTYKKN
jgi:hypothetical protein